MPLVFVRPSHSRQLIKETKDKIKAEIKSMSNEQLREHYTWTKQRYADLVAGDEKKKVLYHELNVIREDLKKRTAATDKKLAKKLTELKKRKIRCPHCGKFLALNC